MEKSEKIATISLYFIFIVVMVFGVLFFYGCKSLEPAVSVSEIYKNSDIYQKQSAIDSRRTVIYSNSGNEKGYLRQSPIDPRVTVEYDKKGNVKGYWKQDPIDSRKIRFHKKK